MSDCAIFAALLYKHSLLVLYTSDMTWYWASYSNSSSAFSSPAFLGLMFRPAFSVIKVRLWSNVIVHFWIFSKCETCCWNTVPFVAHVARTDLITLTFPLLNSKFHRSRHRNTSNKCEIFIRLASKLDSLTDLKRDGWTDWTAMRNAASTGAI